MEDVYLLLRGTHKLHKNRVAMKSNNSTVFHVLCCSKIYLKFADINLNLLFLIKNFIFFTSLIKKNNSVIYITFCWKQNKKVWEMGENCLIFKSLILIFFLIIYIGHLFMERVQCYENECNKQYQLRICQT